LRSRKPLNCELSEQSLKITPHEVEELKSLNSDSSIHHIKELVKSSGTQADFIR
jgi:hypothetical protein